MTLPDLTPAEFATLITALGAAAKYRDEQAKKCARNGNRGGVDLYRAEAAATRALRNKIDPA